MFKSLLLILFVFNFSISSSHAQENSYAYYGFDPDIVTNYVTVKERMGYVRLTVELMVNGEDFSFVEHHAPLLRDAIISIIGQQSESKIKSIKGRTEIQLACEQQVRELLTQETGRPRIKKLLFTQWLDN
ncbi:MAG: flagellar basal body-associated protein FliL [Colwellia sp.]